MKKKQVEFFIPKDTIIHINGIPIKLTKKTRGKTHKNNLSLISFTGFKASSSDISNSKKGDCDGD